MAHIWFDHVSKIYSRQSRQFSWGFFLQSLGKNRQSPIHALRDMSFEVVEVSRLPESTADSKQSIPTSSGRETPATAFLYPIRTNRESIG